MDHRLARDNVVTGALSDKEAAMMVGQTGVEVNLALKAELEMARTGVTEELVRQAANALNGSNDFHATH